MEIISFAASNIFSTIIEDNTDELKNEESFINSFKHKEGFGNHNSDKNNRILEKYSRIKDILFHEWLKVAKDIFKYPDSFTITTSWMTKIDSGDSSQQHLHKNSFYSGVYHFGEYTNDSASIEFSSPLIPFFDFYIKPIEYNIHNSITWSFKPKKNQLLLFPSFVEHRILRQGSNQSRKSLAFNIAPTGCYGEGDSFINTEWLKQIKRRKNGNNK